MFEHIDNTKKHLVKTQKQVSAKVGKEKAEVLLKDLSWVDGSETPELAARWAGQLIEVLEKNFSINEITAIREECTCVYTNKYSAYNKKYFREIQEKSKSDSDYLKNIAEWKSLGLWLQTPTSAFLKQVLISSSCTISRRTAADHIPAF